MLPFSIEDKLPDRCAERAYAKINLCLDVTGKRENGYHDVAMIMQSISVYDWIYMKRTHEVSITMSANLDYVPIDEKNLMVRAAKLMFQKYGLPGGLMMRLEKKIPVAAGLAGGSSDAAAVIRGINSIFKLNLTEQELCDLGAQLGADIPFCVHGGTQLAEGIGEKLTKLPSAPHFYVVLVKPSFSVSTPVVYQGYDQLTEIEHPDIQKMIDGINNGNGKTVLDNLGNVLEEVTIPMHPIIEAIKKDLLAAGAEGAMMSGSGPTVFALFSGKKSAVEALKIIRKQYKRTFTRLTEFV